MKIQDGFTKVLLLLLVVGIWGLLLRPLIVPTSVVAQTNATARRYEFGMFEREVRIGSTGNIYLTARQVTDVVFLAQQSGWRLHSIVPVIDEEDDRFIVVFEK